MLGIYDGQNRKRKIENEKFLKSGILIIYTRTYTREKSKKRLKLMILCRCNGIEYQKIRFKAIFKPTERMKIKNGIVTRLVQNKRSDGLKNRLFGFYVNFCL